jgi:hypothetical protein
MMTGTALVRLLIENNAEQWPQIRDEYVPNLLSRFEFNVRCYSNSGTNPAKLAASFSQRM